MSDLLDFLLGSTCSKQIILRLNLYFSFYDNLVSRVEPETYLNRNLRDCVISLEKINPGKVQNIYFGRIISEQKYLIFFLGDEENFLGELTIPSSWWPSFTAKVKIFVIKGNKHEVRKGGNIKVELGSKN